MRSPRYCAPDNTVEQVTADGHVVAIHKGQVRGKCRSAARRDLPRCKKRGDVGHIDRRRRCGCAGRARHTRECTARCLDFGANNSLRRVHALENVRLVQIPERADGQTTELTANAVDFFARPDGHGLERAETIGSGKIRLLPAPNSTTSKSSAAHTELASAKS